jgi:hypothetical protein
MENSILTMWAFYFDNCGMFMQCTWWVCGITIIGGAALSAFLYTAYVLDEVAKRESTSNEEHDDTFPDFPDDFEPDEDSDLDCFSVLCLLWAFFRMARACWYYHTHYSSEMDDGKRKREQRGKCKQDNRCSI